MSKLDEILRENIKKFDYKVGDKVKVHIKVSEGDTERIQVFDGVIISIKGSGVSKSFTVRKVSYGVGVERVFPVNSPKIDKVELVKSNKVRRAKLNYLRKLSGKAARLNEIALQDEMIDEDNEIKQQENQVVQETKNV